MLSDHPTVEGRADPLQVEGSFGLPFPISYASVSLFDLTPEDAVNRLRDDGYAGIEWKVGEAPHAGSSTAASPFLSDNRCTIVPGIEGAAQVRDLAEASGLALVGLNPYLQVGDTPALEAMFAMAVAAGASQIRFQGPRVGTGQVPYAKLLAQTKEYIAKAETIARETGVRFVLEMHHRTITPSAELAQRAVSDADPTHVGVILDIGNTFWEGYADTRVMLEVLGPYLHHVHLKNVKAKPVSGGRWVQEWSVLDEGFLDVPEFFAQLNEHGYRGWVSIEDMSTVRSPVETMSFNAQTLSRFATEMPV